MVRRKTQSPNVPEWTLRAARRILQVAEKPGRYRFEVQTHNDGRRELAIIPAPKKVERLGKTA